MGALRPLTYFSHGAPMNHLYLRGLAGGASLLTAFAPTALAYGDVDDVPKKPEFTAPVAMKASGEVIRLDDPGYAAPAWHDVNGDGHGDLVVGQFDGGKIAVYAGDEKHKLATRTWLQADGKVAKIPGVW